MDIRALYHEAMESTTPISISVVDHVDDTLVSGFAKLIPQLSSSSPPPTLQQLQAIVEAPSTHLVVARDANQQLIGSMTLVLFRIPTGVRAWIEDVVVDESARGLGAGVAMNSAALKIAYEAGAKTVDLTSRPSRTAAHRLYEKLGFEIRDTAVYRHNPNRSGQAQA